MNVIRNFIIYYEFYSTNIILTHLIRLHKVLHTEISFWNLVHPKINLDLNYNFPINLAPNKISFGAKFKCNPNLVWINNIQKDLSVFQVLIEFCLPTDFGEGLEHFLTE